jgi:hypothetical protein
MYHEVNWQLGTYLVGQSLNQKHGCCHPSTIYSYTLLLYSVDLVIELIAIRDSILNLRSRGPRFETRQGHSLSCLSAFVVSRSLQEHSRILSRLSHKCFLPIVFFISLQVNIISHPASRCSTVWISVALEKSKNDIYFVTFQLQATYCFLCDENVVWNGEQIRIIKEIKVSFKTFPWRVQNLSLI